MRRAAVEMRYATLFPSRSKTMSISGFEPNRSCRSLRAVQAGRPAPDGWIPRAGRRGTRGPDTPAGCCGDSYGCSSPRCNKRLAEVASARDGRPRSNPVSWEAPAAPTFLRSAQPCDLRFVLAALRRCVLGSSNHGPVPGRESDPAVRLGNGVSASRTPWAIACSLDRAPCLSTRISSATERSGSCTAPRTRVETAVSNEWSPNGAGHRSAPTLLPVPPPSCWPFLRLTQREQPPYVGLGQEVGRRRDRAAHPCELVHRLLGPSEGEQELLQVVR
jgi:hypothetical protein